MALQRVDHARHEPQVGAGQDADADNVNVLLRGCRRHLVGSDPHSQVNHLHAGIAERAGDDLDAAVMAVQAELGEEDAGWMARSGSDSRVHRSPTIPRILAQCAQDDPKTSKITKPIIATGWGPSSVPMLIITAAIRIAVTPRHIVPKSANNFLNGSTRRSVNFDGDYDRHEPYGQPGAGVGQWQQFTDDVLLIAE